MAKRVTVFDIYDRAKTGPKVEEKDWDYKIIPRTAGRLKQKYGIKMDKKTIIPTDRQQIDSLYQAGLEMLVECGVYCVDTRRVIKYTEDEVRLAIQSAPSKCVLGEGKEAVVLACRSYDDRRPPIIQGGPTGAPVSEQYFVQVHESYVREPLVDTIVDGVLQTINGHDPVPNSPWEIAAVKSEAILIRAAATRAGRSGIGL
jgi:methylamine--corrinoid protein Co-methyltransferase